MRFKSFVVINTQEGIELRFHWHFRLWHFLNPVYLMFLRCLGFSMLIHIRCYMYESEQFERREATNAISIWFLKY